MATRLKPRSKPKKAVLRPKEVKRRAASGRTVGVRELKNRASQILERVERNGERIIVTRNGREIAQLIPLEDKKLPPLIERLRAQGWEVREATLPVSALWDLPPLNIKPEDQGKALAALLAEREED